MNESAGRWMDGWKSYYCVIDRIHASKSIYCKVRVCIHIYLYTDDDDDDDDKDNDDNNDDNTSSPAFFRK